VASIVATPRPNRGGSVGKFQIGEVVIVSCDSQPSTWKYRNSSARQSSSWRRMANSTPVAQGELKSLASKSGSPVTVSSSSRAERDERLRMIAPACTVHSGGQQQSSSHTTSPPEIDQAPASVTAAVAAYDAGSAGTPEPTASTTTGAG
jgi:hypothetical protein